MLPPGVPAGLLLALALAGCLAAPPGEPPLVQPPPPALAEGCPLALLRSRALGEEPCNVEVTLVNGPANEVHVALNPLDPLSLAGGAKDYTLGSQEPCDVHNVWAGQYWSTDGGRTWGNALVQGHPGDTRPSALAKFRCSSDPVLAFGPDGTAYYVGLAAEPTPEEAAQALGRLGGAASAIWVAASRDGGASYEAPVLVHECQAPACFDDKEWVAVDPRDGTLYVTWALIAPLATPGDAFGVATAHIVVSRSLDGGNTWSPPLAVSPPLEGNVFNQGNTPAVGPGGEVYVTWIDFGTSRLFFTSSRDKGQVWSPPRAIRSIEALPASLPNSEFRTPTLTSMAVDHSRGPARGTVYIAWPDAGAGNGDILLMRSADGGATWSEPVRVNDDTGSADQFFPSVAVAPNGRVDVVFYDRRDDPANKLLTLYYAFSVDGGQTFENVRVGDVLFDGDLGFHQSGAPFLGDYLGVASTNDTAHAFWADTRHGASDVFTAAIRHS